tara:strand:+ start:478 stop:1095 length:618 start_codon:yes stop_codon:yes gene_type:complete
MMSLPLFFALVIGFNHAFEADHVLAVGNIANKRSKLLLAVKDGMYWGLGHTSMIFLVGCLIILAKWTVDVAQFEKFEVLVGLSMIALGGWRVYKYFVHESQEHDHPHDRNHKLAYGMGLVHGLAGSGAVVLLALTDISSTVESLMYLILFGLGSVVGMMIVAGLFNIPFFKKLHMQKSVQLGFVVLSAVLCVGYGSFMVVSYFTA